MQKSKLCTSSKQAERFQWKLYQQWDSVQLVKAPVFQEQGLYIWAVSNAPHA